MVQEIFSEILVYRNIAYIMNAVTLELTVDEVNVRDENDLYTLLIFEIHIL